MSLNTETRAASVGGTGIASYTIGDLLYASASATLSKLNAVATGQVLVSAGTGTAPAWSATPTLSSLTLGAVVTVAAHTLYRENVIRAWAKFNGATATLLQGFNVSSTITVNGTGDWTLTFTAALTNADCCVSVTAVQPNYGCVHSASGGAARIQARDAGGNLVDATIVNVVVLGV